MKKFSIFCILAILCAGLASCDEAIVVNPENTVKSSSASTTTPASVSRDDTGITSSALSTEADPVISKPTVERPKIIYHSEEDCADGALLLMDTVLEFLDCYEELNETYMLCMVTLKEIDYTQIGEEYCTLPITVSID